eukprot:4145888-Alexandrium_andersonii.AAC.1
MDGQFRRASKMVVCVKREAADARQNEGRLKRGLADSGVGLARQATEAKAFQQKWLPVWSGARATVVGMGAATAPPRAVTASS